MELFQILSALLAIVIVSISLRIFKSPDRKHRNPPLAGGRWPIIGHWPMYFRKDSPIHRALGAMADKYGPIFLTTVGSQRLLVISCPEIAKECFTVHDKVLERQSILASEVIGYNNAMLTFSPSNPHWRHMRKILSTELLSTHGMDLFRHVWKSEVEMTLREMFLACESGNGMNIVDMKQKFHDMTLNICLRIIARKRIYGENIDSNLEEEAKKCRELIRKFMDYIAFYPLSQVIPWLGWLDSQTELKDMKTSAEEFDDILQGWLHEHKHKKEEEHKNRDLLDVLLSLDQERFNNNISGLDADTTIKAFCLDVIHAMTDTSMIVLTWALSLLLNNPQCLKKVKDELEIHVGKTRQVEESDINSLVYLQAVVQETLRLYPPVPLLSLRLVMTDFTISNANYDVPVGTQIMINSWKLHRDPKIWPDPDRFMPERFLTTHKDIDAGGLSYNLVPFGLGRRSCPGASLGLRLIHYLLASFLHSFEVEKLRNEDVDMTEINYISNPRANPLEVLIKPRLGSELYGDGK